MANTRGITLIELLVVISVIGILAVALAFNYQGWLGNYRVESQTKGLYSDLMEARTRAMTRSRMHFVEIDNAVNPNNYAIYEDTNENGDSEPGAGDNPIPEFRDPATGNVRPKALQYNLGWAGIIAFDTRGLSASAAVISLTYSGHLNPDYGCISVEQSKIRMGKWDRDTGICDVR